MHSICHEEASLPQSNIEQKFMLCSYYVSKSGQHGAVLIVSLGMTPREAFGNVLPWSTQQEEGNLTTTCQLLKLLTQRATFLTAMTNFGGGEEMQCYHLPQDGQLEIVSTMPNGHSLHEIKDLTFFLLLYTYLKITFLKMVVYSFQSAFPFIIISFSL